MNPISLFTVGRRGGAIGLPYGVEDHIFHLLHTFALFVRHRGMQILFLAFAHFGGMIQPIVDDAGKILFVLRLENASFIRGKVARRG